MKLFPAIDILEGRAVRLLYGKRDMVTDYGDPVDCAKRWIDCGAEYLHVVDLGGAFEGEDRIGHILEKIASLGVPVQTGGGLRTFSAVCDRFSAGASRVVLGTVCVSDPDVLISSVERFQNRIVAGMDALNGYLAVKGWTERSQEKAFDFALRMKALGITDAVFTDISKDGALTGVSLDETVRMGKTGLNIIASGGIKGMDDLFALRERGVYGAILGRSIYTGAIDLKQAIGEMKC